MTQFFRINSIGNLVFGGDWDAYIAYIWTYVWIAILIIPIEIKYRFNSIVNENTDNEMPFLIWNAECLMVRNTEATATEKAIRHVNHGLGRLSKNKSQTVAKNELNIPLFVW